VISGFRREVAENVAPLDYWMLTDIWCLFELACPTSENVIEALSNRRMKKGAEYRI
jgi:hypothetical protein